MRNGLRIARVFGINIGVDWSWLLIFVLVTWNLSAVFGSAHSDWGGWLSWGLALIAAILFFLSVLVHELAHSLVAKARGMPVRNIKLFLFGGVSNIEREPRSPGAEFLMALVGPLTSIVLGVLLVLAGGFSAPLGETMSDPEQVVAQLNPLTTLLVWLGSITSPTMTVDELVHDGVMGTDDHAFPVIDEGQLAGLVTLEDVRAIPRTSWDNTTDRQIMTPADRLVSVIADRDAAEALNRLQARDVRQLPVMRNGLLAGLLRRRDLVKWLQLHSETGLE